jgi:hypothetical protein
VTSEAFSRRSVRVAPFKLGRIPVLKARMNADLHMTVYVKILVPYLDVFKKQHQTSDCLIYRAQTKKFETCTAQHDRHEYSAH